MEQDDAALLAACRAGDSEAWETLVRRYQRLIYSILVRAGLSHDDAAEVFQRVWAILFEQLDTFSEPERLRSWLVTTARSERRRWKQLARGLLPPAGDGQGLAAFALSEQELLPNELLGRMERQHLVRQAMSTLDHRCRLLLSTFFLHQDPPSDAEVADALGIDTDSIGPTRAQCMEKLLNRVATRWSR
jgi:RNA polymerase sigma factor (sigma-70 family)